MILNIIILLLAVPVGFLIALLAKDELAVGKKWFRVLIIVSIVGIIGFWLYGFNSISWTSGFIGIVALINYINSDKI